MFRNKSGIRFAVFAASAGAGAILTAAMAQVRLPEVVETAPLATDAFSTGTLDQSHGALTPNLWRGSDAQTLEFLLTQLPARPAAPSLGEALTRILLSPGAGPAGAAPSLGGKKLLAIVRAGLIDEARTVASLSTANRGDPWVGQAKAVADLLDGDIAAACRRNAELSSGRDELFWVKLRVLCYAEAGEPDAADLTLNILREQGSLSKSDEALLTAAATGAALKIPPVAHDALQYAIARNLKITMAPGQLGKADGGVLAAIARDGASDPATRIAAAQRAVAMGVYAHEALAGFMGGVKFDIAEIGNAAQAARERAGDPLTDALLYQSVLEMSAPEFLRDKAQRIALALGLADSFHRAYALSILYSDEISALEGALLSPDEAARFALARMAVGDSVGAGHWLSAMIGANGSVTALPEQQAMTFIDHVNLLAVLDPQTATLIARAAGVSLLAEEPVFAAAASSHNEPAVMARILDAAFDAAVEGKVGQAGLAALAASAGAAPGGGEVETVVIDQSLRIAGLSELRRSYAFEHAWALRFSTQQKTPVAAMPLSASADDGGLKPRLKPALGQ